MSTISDILDYEESLPSIWFDRLKNDGDQAKLVFRPPFQRREKTLQGQRVTRWVINVHDVEKQETRLFESGVRFFGCKGGLLGALKAAGVSDDRLEDELPKRVFLVTRRGARGEISTRYEFELLPDPAPDLSGVALIPLPGSADDIPF